MTESPFFFETKAQASSGIAAIHSVLVLLRYLTSLESLDERRKRVSALTKHVQGRLTDSERAIARSIVNVIETQEGRSIDRLDSRKTNYWVRELAGFADQLSRAEVAVNPELGRRLLEKFRGQRDAIY
jgi:hypothetical protein